MNIHFVRAGSERRKALDAAKLSVLACLLLFGCAAGSTSFSRSAADDIPARIALLPVADMARIYGVEQSVKSPLTGKVFVTGEEAPALAGALTAEIEAHLRGRGFDLVTPEAIGSAMATLSAEVGGARSERSLIMDAARRVEAGAALVGYLYRSRERQGARFAVEAPASVAYGLYLIDAGSGRLLWSAEFDETQRPLSENLFHVGTFLRRRGEWISAEQMATVSIREILAGFPALPAGGGTEGGLGD